MSQTRRNKNNAQRAQKEVAAKLATALNMTAGSPIAEPGDCDIKPKCMGEPGEDIVMCSKRAQDLDLSIEVKYGKGFTKIEDSYLQAEKNSKGKMPLVCIKPTRSKRIYAVIDLDHLLKRLSL